MAKTLSDRVKSNADEETLEDDLEPLLGPNAVGIKPGDKVTYSPKVLNNLPPVKRYRAVKVLAKSR